MKRANLLIPLLLFVVMPACAFSVGSNQFLASGLNIPFAVNSTTTQIQTITSQIITSVTSTIVTSTTRTYTLTSNYTAITVVTSTSSTSLTTTQISVSVSIIPVKTTVTVETVSVTQTNTSEALAWALGDPTYALVIGLIILGLFACIGALIKFGTPKRQAQTGGMNPEWANRQ